MKDKFSDGQGAEVVMKITCQRCQYTCFVAQTGHKNCINYVTNSHNITDKFEEVPEGWMVKANIGWCCPDCAQEYDKMMKNFILNATEKCEEIYHAYQKLSKNNKGIPK
jgi:hypothetical protein